MTTPDRPASEDAPIYSKAQEDTGTATKLYMVVCDEGWRSTVVCSGMYEWAADWMVEQLGRRPYAPNHRPDRRNHRERPA